MSPERSEQNTNPFESQLKQELGKLKDSKSSHRNVRLHKMARVYMEDPGELMEAISLLEGSLSEEPCAEKLSRRLKSERVLSKKLCNIEYLQNMLGHVDGPHGELVEGILESFISQPAEIYQKNNNSIKAATRRATKITNVLAEALMGIEESGEEGCLIKALEIIHKETINMANSDSVNILDLGFLAATVGDRDTSELAGVSLGTIGLLSSIYSERVETGLDDESISYIDISVTIGSKVNKLLEAYGEVDRKKNEISPYFKFITALEYIELEARAMKTGIPFYNEKVEPIATEMQNYGYILSPPQKLPLAEKAILRQMFEVTSSLEENGFDSEIVAFPNGAYFFMMWKKGKFNEQQQKSLVQEKLIEYLKEPSEEEMDSSELDPYEVETLIKYLAPEFDPEKLGEKKAELEEMVKSGWYAISKRGNEVKFGLPEEDWIRKMGISRMSFRQKDQKLEVTIDWGSWQTNFHLDSKYKPIGLNGISEDYKDWIVTFSLAYLSAIKNPERAMSVCVEENGKEYSTAEADERKIWGRRPHLKILPVGWEAHLDDDSLEKARYHFGVDLVRLNTYYSRIQDGMKPLSTLLEHESTPTKQVYRRFLVTALKRVIPREERPRWYGEGERGREMLLTKPIIGIDKPRYMITYVKETEVERGRSKPVPIQCPGVAAEIIKLSEQVTLVD